MTSSLPISTISTSTTNPRPTSTSSTQQQITTTKNNNSVTTQTLTPPLKTSVATTFTTARTTSINSETQSKPTQQQAPSTNNKSETNGTTVGIAAGVVGAIGLGACVGAIGFYAYRKKSQAKQPKNSVVNDEVGTALQDKKTDNYQKIPMQSSAEPVRDYAQINLKNVDQSDNNIPVSNSNYGRIDEMKQSENQYDKPIKLEI